MTPLLVDPGGHHKFVAFRFGAVALLVLIGVLVSRAAPPTRVLVAAGGVVVATGMATAAARDPLLALLGDTTRMDGLGALVVAFGALLVGAGAGRDAWRAITTGFGIAGAGVTAFGLLQMAHVVHHVGRPTSTLGNADFLGGFLCLLIPIVLVRALDDPRWWPFVAGASVLLAGTQTRGAWIGAAVGVAYVIAVRWVRAALLPLIAGGVAVLALTALPHHGDRGSPDTGQGRLDTWAISARVIAARPLLGWGPEGFRVGFERHRTDAWIARYGTRQIQDRAHNRELDIAAATGAVGLAADLAFVVGVALELRRVRDPLLVGGVGALLAWFVAGQFLFDTFDLRVLAWLVAGVLIGAGDRPRLALGWVAAPLAAVVWIGAVNLVADREVQSASGKSPSVAFTRLANAIELRPRALDAYGLLARVAIASRDPVLIERSRIILAGWHDDDVARLLRR